MESGVIVDLTRPSASYVVAAVGSLKPRESRGRGPSNLSRQTRVLMVQLYGHTFGKAEEPPVFENQTSAECGVVDTQMRLGSESVEECSRHSRAHVVHDGVVRFVESQREEVESFLVAFARQLAEAPEFDSVTVTFDGRPLATS